MDLENDPEIQNLVLQTQLDKNVKFFIVFYLDNLLIYKIFLLILDGTYTWYMLG